MPVASSFLKCSCNPDIEVSTLGWKLREVVPDKLYKEHIQFDLNECDSREITSSEAPFDLIVFSETIEHFYTSPAMVPKSLKTLLTPQGAIFIQTPNAATARDSPSTRRNTAATGCLRIPGCGGSRTRFSRSARACR